MGAFYQKALFKGGARSGVLIPRSFEECKDYTL